MKQEEIVKKVSGVFGPDVIQATTEFRGEAAVTVLADKIVEVCRFLRDDPELSFAFLSFVGGVDWYPQTPRFEIVYQLYSVKHRHRFRVKARIDGDSGADAAIDSVTGLWPTANWHERETAEMFGIVFRNHPDPRKLLLPDNWKVHPLRKDFPVTGTEEDTPDLPTRAGGS